MYRTWELVRMELILCGTLGNLTLFLEAELLRVEPLYGTLGNLNLEKDPGTFGSETCIWNLGEPELLRAEPLWQLGEPGRFRAAWKNPKLFLGKKPFPPPLSPRMLRRDFPRRQGPCSAVGLGELHHLLGAQLLQQRLLRRALAALLVFNVLFCWLCWFC